VVATRSPYSTYYRAQHHTDLSCAHRTHHHDELKGLMRAKVPGFRLTGKAIAWSMPSNRASKFVQIALGSRESMTLSALSAPLYGGSEASAAGNRRPYRKNEGFHHIAGAVLGKKSVIGTLALGSRHRLHVLAPMK